MIEPFVIWRAANQMIKRHGNGATLECALRADEMLEKGDQLGQKMWLAMRRAATSLLENGPPTDISNA